MVKFNPTNIPDDKLTYGDLLNPMFEIRDAGEAREYLTQYALYMCRGSMHGLTMDKALDIAVRNFEYFSKYYDTPEAYASVRFIREVRRGMQTNQELEAMALDMAELRAIEAIQAQCSHPDFNEEDGCPDCGYYAK